MRVFLGALGWVNEAPIGNRLRWSVPLDEVVEGRFLGLPASVIIERAILPPGPVGDTTFLDAPTWPIPLDWWEDIGDFNVEFTTPARFNLPKTVQAIRFLYQGAETYIRVFDPEGTVVLVRRITPGQLVLIEETEIAAIEFLIGGAVMLQTTVLDLFAGHDQGLAYEQIAVLAPQVTTGMTLEAAEQRLNAPSGIDTDEWIEFQQEIVTAALLSMPETPTDDQGGITRWEQFRTLISVRWRISLLYGLGFLDGPDVGPGAGPDQVFQDLILQDLPTRPHIYRVHCIFENQMDLASNPIVVQPLVATPLQPPVNLQYDHARVRLFDGVEYELDARLSMGTNDRRVIGCEIEEEIGPSEILGSAMTLESYTFQSWQPPDWSGHIRLDRAATLLFYDLPLCFRARNVDGWDRASAWSAKTPPILPDFVHRPAPPPLLDAQFRDGETRLFPRTSGNSFANWEPDHAAANTPGTVLEVMRRTDEPAIVTVELVEPIFEQSGPADPFDRFRANFTDTLTDPERFEGGSLIAAGMRASIAAIDANSVAFRPIADGTDTTAMPGPGSAKLQQPPNHPDLFLPIESRDITDLPPVIEFLDVLPQPSEETAVSYYAVRVDMGIATGGLSNTVATMRHPETPPTPPPFSVEILGVDFFDRTMVRIRFLESAPMGTYVVTWADGLHEVGDFHDEAIEGDYGPQTALDGFELFESFSLPVQKTLERMVTIGVQAKTSGGFVSDYAILPVALPIYQP